MHLLADHGWRLLPLYRFDPRSGQWEHRGRVQRPASLEDMLRSRPAPFARAPESALARQLAAAREILRHAPPAGAAEPTPLSPELERIRWFPLPGEAIRMPAGGGRDGGRPTDIRIAA
jgi:hypothetical protein